MWWCGDLFQKLFHSRCDPSRATDRCPQNCHFSPTSSGHCDNFHSTSCRLSRKQAVWNGCRATSVELMCNLWEEISSTREHNSLNVCKRQAQTILRLCPTNLQRMCNKCASSMWGCVHRASGVQQMWNSFKQTAALTEEKSTRGHSCQLTFCSVQLPSSTTNPPQEEKFQHSTLLHSHQRWCGE